MAIRARVLSAAPLCPHCQRDGVVRLAQEVDHIRPLHDGGTDDFDNLVGLCREHHLAKSVRERGATYHGGCDANGIPLDAAHHWSGRD